MVTRECEECEGDGEVTCPYCNNGITECGLCGQDTYCEECNGGGYVECDECDGSGEVEADESVEGES